jgi:excinuclease ABC subunit C
LTNIAFNPEKVLAGMTSLPGVYRFLDGRGRALYVGKAGNLRKRVSSYFGRRQDSPKSRAMLARVRAIDVTVTRTEGEALLLESNLIKSLRPRYNVLFRDDKSYPYLYLSLEHAFPRLSFYRGPRRGRGRYFGPFPGARAARQTLNLAQKLFRIRQCDDAFFRARRRPCLQYQIDRCTAPCVDLIGPAEYAQDVRHATLFLEGRNEAVIDALTGPMQRAAEALDFERAAQFRDRIASLRRIQEQQIINAPRGECDIVACSRTEQQACVLLLHVRRGRIVGNRPFFPEHEASEEPAAIIGAFLKHRYLGRDEDADIPPEILVSHSPREAGLLERVLSAAAGRNTRIIHRTRGERTRWIAMARDNADISLRQRLSLRERTGSRLETLRGALGLADVPGRIECFDISHSSGEATVAACIVYGEEGALKADYRRFNITGNRPGDDYAALSEALERRYSRQKREDRRLPDLVLVDGGRGQINAARKVMAELQLDEIPLIGIAKGPSRKPGLEQLIMSREGRALRLPPDSPALHLLQEIRDEAHRFAITGHRRRRERRRSRSTLEEIPGIGSRRRQSLLRHFGGLQGVARAGIEELAMVPGINKNLARKIYDALHGS